MNDVKLNVKFKTLFCYENDEDKYDNIFLKYAGNKIWPIDKKYKNVEVGSVSLGIEINDVLSSEELVIEVWDYDTFSFNDLLGEIRINPDQRGSFSSDMKPKSDKDFARYGLGYSVG